MYRLRTQSSDAHAKSARCIDDRRTAFNRGLSPDGQYLGDAVNHQDRKQEDQQAADDQRGTRSKRLPASMASAQGK